MKATRIDFSGHAPLAVTYIVSEWNEVFWWPFYTRHIWLAEAIDLAFGHISWGGILDTQGNWLRASYDFGDAPSEYERNLAVKLINEQYLHQGPIASDST